MKRNNILLALFTFAFVSSLTNKQVVVNATNEVSVTDFYNLLTFTDNLSKESINVVDNKIVNSNSESWTEFTLGSQDGADTKTISFDITLNYKAEQWSSVTFQFRRWDANSL